jgi:hypothetical protein
MTGQATMQSRPIRAARCNHREARFFSRGPRDVRDGRRSQGRGGRGSHPSQSTDAEMILFARSRQSPNPLGVMRRMGERLRVHVPPALPPCQSTQITLTISNATSAAAAAITLTISNATSAAAAAIKPIRKSRSGRHIKRISATTG